MGIACEQCLWSGYAVIFVSLRGVMDLMVFWSRVGVVLLEIHRPHVLFSDGNKFSGELSWMHQALLQSIAIFITFSYCFLSLVSVTFSCSFLDFLYPAFFPFLILQSFFSILFLASLPSVLPFPRFPIEFSTRLQIIEQVNCASEHGCFADV